MKETLQKTIIIKKIEEFNRQCAAQCNKPTPTSANKYHKRVHNYLIDTECVLGEGTFSTVYRGKDIRNEKVVAVKIIQINKIKKTGIEHLFKEQINIIQSLNHPNIVACHEYFRTTNNCYTVYQYCEGGDLASLLQKGHFGDKQDLRQANTYIKDVFQGLLYLESLNVVHRDIKAANVFLHKGSAKIGDFGFATRCSSQFKDASIGSPAYMAPEGLIHQIYGPKTDVWAFGMLIYEMLHGNSPFYECCSQLELKLRIKVPINWDQFKTNLPSALKRLILKCLKVDSRQRPSFTELLNDEYICRLYCETALKNNSKSNYSSKTSDTQKIFESTRIARIMQALKQRSEDGSEINREEGQQINRQNQEETNRQEYSVCETNNQEQEQRVELKWVAIEEGEQQPHKASKSRFDEDDSECRQEDMKQKGQSEEVQQSLISKLEQKDIVILKYLMPCTNLSPLFQMLQTFLKTISLHAELQLDHNKLLTVYSLIDQIIKELHFIAQQNNNKQQIQTIRGCAYRFYQTLLQSNIIWKQAASCDGAVESVFELIKQVEMMIDKQDISLHLQNRTKIDSKVLVLLGNHLIQSYYLLDCLKAKQSLQVVDNKMKSSKLQSSQQFYIWLYQLQLARMDQV